MHCDHCHKPLPDDAPIWRVSVAYSVNDYVPSTQSWCEACAGGEWLHWQRWRPPSECHHCGRTVILTGRRPVPLHIVCGDACRNAIYTAQARARRARFGGKGTCQSGGKPG
jgi:hypothetical protein